jgi:transposase
MTSTTTTAGTLYIALELGWDKWLLACATQPAQKPRYRSMPARNLEQLREEIAKAKQRFGLPADAPVCTCYEAGRDGFWLHRALTSLGVQNVVVDSAAIEVNRRRKRAKTDPVDAAKLLNLLCRYHGGERKVWSVVNDRRHVRAWRPDRDARRRPKSLWPLPHGPACRVLAKLRRAGT